MDWLYPSKPQTFKGHLHAGLNWSTQLFPTLDPKHLNWLPYMGSGAMRGYGPEGFWISVFGILGLNLGVLGRYVCIWVLRISGSRCGPVSGFFGGFGTGSWSLGLTLGLGGLDTWVLCGENSCLSPPHSLEPLVHSMGLWRIARLPWPWSWQGVASSPCKSGAVECRPCARVCGEVVERSIAFRDALGQWAPIDGRGI